MILPRNDTTLQVVAKRLLQMRNSILRSLRRWSQCVWYDPSAKDVQEILTTHEVVPAGPAKPCSIPMSSKIAFGCGCYWGTEKFITKDFQQRFPGSIRTARVGFMSPHSDPPMQRPTYRQVCSGKSGHVEVLLVELKDPQAHLEELIRFVCSFHDPTQRNRQGNDRGPQYASWIFCSDSVQTDIARQVLLELQAALHVHKIRTFVNRKVHTQIAPLREFVKGPVSHQQYLTQTNPSGYCNHYLRLRQWYTLKPKEAHKKEGSKKDTTKRIAKKD